jgi:flagellar hook-basal body complex protein FliE
MAAIQPTGGVRPPMVPLGTPGASRQQPPVQRDFAQVLKSYVGAVDQKQQASYAAIKDLIAGKTDNVLPAVHAMAKADLSFKLLMGVRNKVIEAYKQTMNMQV